MKKIKKSIALKTIIGIVLVLVLFALLVSIFGYREFEEELYEQYIEGAFRIARAAVFSIDGDEISAYRESLGKSEAYQAVWTRLDHLCNASEATFIYVIQPDLSDYSEITFLFSTVNRNSSYTPYEVGYVRETTNDEYREKYRALYAGEAEEELLLLASRQFDASVHHITAMVPVRDTEGRTQAILCVQRQMDALTAVRDSYLKSVRLVLLSLVFVVIIGAWLLLNRLLILPIRKISDEAGRFAAESVPAGQKLTESIRNSDEIGLLADSIDRMEDQIVSYVENLTRITAEKERLGTELDIARRIQETMLPLVFPPFPERKDFEIYATMNPAREVGGDFYDFFLVDSDHLGLVIADVSGKGIPAAMFMTITKKLIKERIMLGESPAEAFYNVNNQLCDGNETDMFVTVWLAVLNLSTGKGIAANAGHEHPAVCRAGENYKLSLYRHSLALAVMPGVSFREHSFELQPGDSIFVYTDGVPEATDSANNLFGTGRMLEALNLDPSSPPEKLLQTVAQSIDSFVGDAPQFDDITMLSLHYIGHKKKQPGKAPADPV